MNNTERIADRVEEIIGRMLAHFQSFDSGATQYSMFYNPPVVMSIPAGGKEGNRQAGG